MFAFNVYISLWVFLQLTCPGWGREIITWCSLLQQTVADSRVILGGGWPEILMAHNVDELARKTPGKKSLSIESFASALRAIPTIIADNAGLDSADLVAQLRAEHTKSESNTGIDVITGTVSSYVDLFFFVPYSVFSGNYTECT